MEHKHTPGPWLYEAGRDGRPPYVIRGTEGGFSVVGMTANRQEADARLFAAAPDLLEALCMLLDGVNTYAPEYMHGLPKKDYTRKALAAIAKATGSES